MLDYIDIFEKLAKDYAEYKHLDHPDDDETYNYIDNYGYSVYDEYANETIDNSAIVQNLLDNINKEDAEWIKERLVGVLPLYESNNCLKEATVFTKTLGPAFFVVKYHRFDKDWYLGEDSLVEDLEDAEAFNYRGDAQERIADFIKGLFITNEIPAYEIEDWVEAEKELYGEDYEAEKKKASGLIDEWPAVDYIKKNMEIKGVFVEKFRESNRAKEELKHIKLGESKLKESVSGLKITNVSVEPKWIYDTYKGPIRVNATINGKEALFSFEAARSGNIFFAGVDCNKVVVLSKRDEDMPAYLRYSRGITISHGGTQTHYALQIYASTLKSAPKENQKDFRFTGQNYSTKPVKDVFKQKLEALYQNNELTQEFLDTFEIPPYGTNPPSKSVDSVEKMKKWQSGERGFNLKAASDAKLKANLKICREIGFDEGADKIQAELDSRGVDFRESKLKEFKPGDLVSVVSDYNEVIPGYKVIKKVSQEEIPGYFEKSLDDYWEVEKISGFGKGERSVEWGQRILKESNSITTDLPEDLDDFLHDIAQEYPHSLSYGDLIHHEYTEDNITDLYEIMTTCEKRDYDPDFIENVAVPAIERIFFGPEPNPEDYEPTYKGYLKYCKDTNGEPYSKEEWTKITGLTENTHTPLADRFVKWYDWESEHGGSEDDYSPKMHRAEEIIDKYLGEKGFDMNIDDAIDALPLEGKIEIKDFLDKEENQSFEESEEDEEESWENYSLFVFDDESEYNDFENLRGFTDYSTEDSCYAIFHADNDEAALAECKSEVSKKEVAVLCRRYSYNNHEPIYIKYENSKEWRNLRKASSKEEWTKVTGLKEYKKKKGYSLDLFNNLVADVEQMIQDFDVFDEDAFDRIQDNIYEKYNDAQLAEEVVAVARKAAGKDREIPQELKDKKIIFKIKAMDDEGDRALFKIADKYGITKVSFRDVDPETKELYKDEITCYLAPTDEAADKFFAEVRTRDIPLERQPYYLDLDWDYVYDVRVKNPERVRESRKNIRIRLSEKR